MEIEYGEITTKKITKNLYTATCQVLKPIKSEVNMLGVSEEISKEKLQLFLDDKPYKHLDNL